MALNCCRILLSICPKWENVPWRKCDLPIKNKLTQRCWEGKEKIMANSCWSLHIFALRDSLALQVSNAVLTGIQTFVFAIITYYHWHHEKREHEVLPNSNWPWNVGLEIYILYGIRKHSCEFNVQSATGSSPCILASSN